MRRQQKKIIIAVASLYIRCAERKENPVSKRRHGRIEDSKTGADVVYVQATYENLPGATQIKTDRACHTEEI
jgi:hypothetical protein